MLNVENISIQLGSFELNDISFEVEKGEYFVVLGESGVGKTVLLEILAGLLKQDTGSIVLEGKDISNEAIQKRGLGLVYQDQALFPHMNVRENIKYALKVKKMKSAKIAEQLAKVAEQVGIEDLLDRNTETLSLGEAQRVALARTLVSEPKILLLDEPLASLDIQAKTHMRSLLRKINQSGQTIIHITHDYEEAIALAAKIAILEQNSIAQIDIPDEIFIHPKSEFIANFVGIKNFYKGELSNLSDKLAMFKVDDTDGLEFFTAVDKDHGRGNLVVRSEDITIFKSMPESSAKNHFSGKIIDIEPATRGIEIIIDIGVPIAALITKESLVGMNLKIGDDICIVFKATAPKFIGLE